MAFGNIMEKAAPNVDFIVHVYMYPTAFTRMYADIILHPMA